MGKFMFDNELKRIDNLQHDINSLRPLDDVELNQLKEYYRIGLTYSSNALEGNSLLKVKPRLLLKMD